ncbi:hypothetical protein VIBNIFTn2_120083 [Vibrio nigripulchritudo FTn2]|nr:hypothetical protein VIBNIFTn2_120083 [Vibrio nigripulchritudo FTn2]
MNTAAPMIEVMQKTPFHSPSVLSILLRRSSSNLSWFVTGIPPMS